MFRSPDRTNSCNFDDASIAMKLNLVIILCLLAAASFAQGVRILPVSDTIHAAIANDFRLKPATLRLTNFRLNAPSIPVDLFTQHLPFFCRQELRMQQAHFPVTFRLGSVEQCDYLEKKKSELRLKD